MSTSPPLWNAELFAKFDAIDRDATLDDDEDEWRAFEQQVEEEVQRRGKGQEYARIDKGKAVDGTSAEYPPSSPPLFDEDPLPSDPPASELRAGPSSSSARRPVSTLAAMPRSFAAVKANTPARLTNTFFSAPTIQTPSGPPPLRPPPAMVTPRALGGRPFDSPADFPTPVQTQSQTPGTFGGRRRDDPASPAPLETDARSELLNRRDLQKLSTRHELFLKKHHSALGRAAKPVSGRPPVRTVSTSMRSLVGGILKGMRFVIASETKQVAKHEKYWDVVSYAGCSLSSSSDHESRRYCRHSARHGHYPRHLQPRP
jgi:hypothetical protein